MVGAVITLLCDEARKIWCYRWFAGATALLIFVLGAVYVLRMPDVYAASGQIYVNRETPLTAAAEGVSLVGPQYGSPYVIQKTLLNDANLETVVRQLNPAAGAMSKQQLAREVARLRGRIHVAPDQGDGFVEFMFADPDPARAQRAAELLLEQFIAKNLDRSRTDLERAGRFLDGQIADYEAKLMTSQAQLADFRRRNPIVDASPLMPVQSPPDYSALLARETPATAAPSGPSPAAVRAAAAAERVNQLEAKLAGLRTTYTEQYPDVAAARRQLADAVALRDAEMARAAAEAPPVAAVAEAAPARRYTPPPIRYVPQQPVMPVIPPAIAAEWAELRRKDEVLRGAYEALVARREATRMSQAVYGPEGGKYQVTREPVRPLFPIGPNRTLYLALVAVLSAAGGLGAGYLRAAINGIFVAPRELENAFQLPVVGTVSWEPAWRTGRRPQTGLLSAFNPQALLRRGRSAAS
jgi:uncharacterized protein involved in exopolysaccharide biosynthesis